MARVPRPLISAMVAPGKAVFRVAISVVRSSGGAPAVDEDSSRSARGASIAEISVNHFGTSWYKVFRNGTRGGV